MTGLLVLAQPGAATAAEKTDNGDVETTVLHPTVTGTGGSIRYSVASLTGGGVQVSFVYVPNEAAGEKSGKDETQSKDFTVTVDAKAIATQTVTDDGDAIVPATKSSSSDETSSGSASAAAATGAVVDQEASEDSTEVTLQASTEGVQTVWVLPEQAPAAADPDDQSWVTRTWHLLVDKITGNDSAESSDNAPDSNNQDDQDGKEEQGSGDEESTPTAAPTSSPTSNATSSAAASSTSSPSSSSTSSPPSSTETTDEDDSKNDNDSSGDTSGDTCDVTQADAQLTTSVEDNTVDAPLEDGPSAAPTFSDEVRKKAAERASDCGEGSSSDNEDPAEDQAGEQDSEEGRDEVDATPASTSSGKGKVEVAAGDWLSGISGDRPAIEKLRGVPAEVATTWTDYSGNADQLNPGAEFGPDKWDKSLIIAMPPFPDGSSWEATADGQNDEYLRHAFSTMKSKWAGRDGTAYIEYGYEANGYWMSWHVQAGQEDAWTKAFQRARSIQQEEFPDARLGVRFNHESNGYDGDSHDLIQAVKGSIDFLGASYYNAYPYVASKAEFDERATMLDGGGGPKGIKTWLAAARSAGLPIEFGEWSVSAKDGDAGVFVTEMHDTFSSNAGPGAGDVFAESLFNIDKDNDNWRLNSGKVPESAAAYGKAFSDVG
ncbi:hypothetical protein [Kineococcus radiotolerans]|nr:hypothetical protein [Kineococcus radiotolerans]